MTAKCDIFESSTFTR